MLCDFPSCHSQYFHGQINASYRNNRNRKQIINISNQEKNLNNDIPVVFREHTTHKDSKSDVVAWILASTKKHETLQ